MSQETSSVDRDVLRPRSIMLCDVVFAIALVFQPFVPAEYLTDDNMAKFIKAVGDGNDYKVRSIWLPLRHD